jgi:hypothetical protein
MGLAIVLAEDWFAAGGRALDRARRRATDPGHALGPSDADLTTGR